MNKFLKFYNTKNQKIEESLENSSDFFTNMR